MCGRYGFSVKHAKDVYERFDTYNELSDYHPRWNIAPGQHNPVITKHSPNYISRMKWGLIPHWAKYDSSNLNTITARVEAIEKKITLQQALSDTTLLSPGNRVLRAG
jgi:putative SOS response-associated peptidase YedK